MICPRCDMKTEVIKSVVGATATDRLRSCPKHGRFWSVERLLRWVVGVTGNPPATASQPPANPPATHGQPAGNNSPKGGLGGSPLPSSLSLSFSPVNPAPTEPPDQTPARVETRPRKRTPADPVVSARAQAIVAVFCEEWKSLKGSDYRPTARDAGAAMQLAKTWTDVPRWREIVRAYLRKPLWGNRQACLWDVAMTPNGHDGVQPSPAGRPSRSDGNVDVLKDWLAAKQEVAR